MKDDATIDISLINELENLLRQKSALLREYILTYTEAMEHLQSDRIDELSEKLVECLRIQNSVDRIENEVIKATSGCGQDDEIIAVLRGASSDGSSFYKELAKEVSSINRLLKNCKILNEKLTYETQEAQNDLMKRKTAAKNRQMIKNSYGSQSRVKTGMVIDC